MRYTKDKSLEKYIEAQLEKPAPDNYDPVGKSRRSILLRRKESYFKSLAWCTKHWYKDVLLTCKEFSLDTTVGELLALPVILTISVIPIAPVISEWYTVRQAVRRYKIERQF